MPPKKTAVAARALRIDTPRVFLPLLAPARYKGAYGGRGSGKSHFFAELLIEDCLCERGMLAVSIREVQKSLKDSSKRLIEAKLAELGLGEADGFKVYEKEIRTPGDGVIIFIGMQDPGTVKFAAVQFQAGDDTGLIEAGAAIEGIGSGRRDMGDDRTVADGEAGRGRQ